MNDRVIVILNFKTPNKINQQKNSKHIAYIAKREGAATELDQDLDQIFKDEYEAEKEVIGKQVNHGLFNADGPANLESIKREMLNHNGVVWRMKISLREEDARRLHMTSRRDWEMMIKDQIANIQKSMNLRNIKWVAAYHPEQGHPHLHLVLWEKDPWRKKGMFPQQTIEKIQNSLIKQIYKPDRIRELQENDAIKDYLVQKQIQHIEQAKEIISEIRGEYDVVEKEFKSIGAVSDRLQRNPYKDEVKQIMGYLEQVKKLIPKSGRVQFSYLPHDAKKEMLNIIENLSTMKDYEYLFNKHNELVSNISDLSGHTEEYKNKNIEKKEKELMIKLANIFLKAAFALKKEETNLAYSAMKGANGHIGKGEDGGKKNWNTNNENFKTRGMYFGLIQSVFRSTLGRMERECDIVQAQGDRIRMAASKKSKKKQMRMERRMDYENER